jgi:hypothetical protein
MLMTHPKCGVACMYEINRQRRGRPVWKEEDLRRTMLDWPEDAGKGDAISSLVSRLNHCKTRCWAQAQMVNRGDCNLNKTEMVAIEQVTTAVSQAGQLSGYIPDRPRTVS